MTEHDVVIAGAGPTGLMLAAELALGGVDVVVVERRLDQAVEGMRAGGLHARTIEELDLRGVADRFLARGKVMQVAGFALIPLDISDAPSRRAHGLALPQQQIEELLAAWVDELGVPIRRGRDVTGLAQDGDGVDVALDDATTLRARYLVGCDGGRSVVRRLAGIELTGWDASLSYLLAECTMADEPAWGARHDDRGVHAIAKVGDGRRARVVSVERAVETGTPTIDDLRAALVDVYGTDFGAHDVTWISRFTDAARQATTYRAGRVLLAGDAAHVHGPMGGQGLNLGVQDAMNLGWKLAQVVRGDAPDTLVDTYTAERHPVAARVLRLTLAMVALGRGDDRTGALRDVVADLFTLPDARRRYGAILSGLHLRHDLGDGHPLLGRRMPDLDLATDDGPRTVASLLHPARPVLLALGAPAALDLTGWTDRVTRVDARHQGPFELPVLGAVAAPAAVLIRPDGYVAWVGDGTDAGLRDALTTWFGPPR